MNGRIRTHCLVILPAISMVVALAASAGEPPVHSGLPSSLGDHAALQISRSLGTDRMRGLSETAVWMVEADQDHAWLGWQVATAGDVNGDGFSDVLVSGPFYNQQFIDYGEVWLFYGSATGLSATPDWIATHGADVRFGASDLCVYDIAGRRVKTIRKGNTGRAITPSRGM